MDLNTVSAVAKAAKKDSFQLAALAAEIRNSALQAIAEELLTDSAAIASANEKDLASAKEAGLPDPIIKRLKFDEKKLGEVVQGIRDLIGLPDPIGRILTRRQLDEGLLLEQVSCPIGVIGVIFESRPDALVQIASLCLKSGNCAILKGGSEAKYTNRTLFEIIHKAGARAGIPGHFVVQLESRADINELLQCHESIDLIIPRGSNAFVRHIMDNSDIPVMGHADGVCHVYIDRAADPTKAIPIARDSKIQYAAACNAVETLLVHRDAATKILPPLRVDLESKGVRLLGDSEAISILSGIEPTREESYQTEYLDLVLNLKIVSGLEEAIDYINHYGSHHTDCIVTEDPAAAETFMALVDSAGVYHNCSTRFADGFRYGLGAEVGISTGKLHARGPVGLEGLQTYKYRLHGKGQIVDDYAEGRKAFHFRELQKF